MGRFRHTVSSYGLLLLFLLLSLEAASYVAYYLVDGRMLSYEDARRERAAILEAGGKTQNVSQAPRVTKETIHPYLGYVYDPDQWTTLHAGLPVTEWGFVDDKPPLQKKSKDHVIVGVFGGSVAWWYSRYGIQSTIGELKKLPQYRSKEFVVVRTALGGFKQPQQLMALTYLLSLGAEFDILINLDGFNEAVLPVLYNIPRGVYPFYPQSWQQLTTMVPSTDHLRTLVTLQVLNDRREWLAATMELRPLRVSATANLVWRLYDRRLQLQIAEATQTATDSPMTRRGAYVTHGPTYPPREITKQIISAVKLWYRTSLLLRDLCAANGIQYFHFLQPNQYVPDSKPMGEEERRIAYSADHPQRVLVEDAYPRLRRMGEMLASEGVHFFDLTQMFKDHPEAVYIDNCCHISEPGNALLGRTIGGAIEKALSKNEQ